MSEQEPSAANGKPSADPAWERDLVGKLLFASLNEQRRARRWNVFFKSLIFVYLFGLLFLVRQDGASTSMLGVGRHTALIEVHGVIAEDTDASADNVIEALEAAFENSNTAGVILHINSPGGSPVQAGQINEAIKRLREEHLGIPIYTVISDVCASGGYYVAAASDEIYADKASIVGSIGVRMDSFGFVDAIDKLGIERRLMTAGEHKGFLDPFLPQNPSDVQHVQKLLDTIHHQFIEVVKDGRGERLKETPDMFSGLVWTGEQGVELGLVDGLGDADYVARERIGAEEIMNFTVQPNWLDRVGDRLGAAMARVLTSGAGGGLGLR